MTDENVLAALEEEILSDPFLYKLKKELREAGAFVGAFQDGAPGATYSTGERSIQGSDGRRDCESDVAVVITAHQGGYSASFTRYKYAGACEINLGGMAAGLHASVRVAVEQARELVRKRLRRLQFEAKVLGMPDRIEVEGEGQ